MRPGVVADFHARSNPHAQRLLGVGIAPKIIGGHKPVDASNVVAMSSAARVEAILVRVSSGDRPPAADRSSKVSATVG